MTGNDQVVLTLRRFLSLQYLSQCDIVLYMKNGKIAERGTYDELIANNGVKVLTGNLSRKPLRPQNRRVVSKTKKNASY